MTLDFRNARASGHGEEATFPDAELRKVRASLSAAPRLGQVNRKQRFFYIQDHLSASVESFEPLFQEIPISHTVPARAGSWGGFCAQVKNY